MSKDAPASPFGTALKALKIAERAALVAGAAQSAAAGAKSTMNSAAIVGAHTIVAPAATDLVAAPSGFPRYKVSVSGGFQGAAVDDIFTVQIIRDPAGAAVLVGPAQNVSCGHATADASYAIAEWIDTPGSTAVLKYAAQITGGANASVSGAGQCLVTVTPLAA